MTEKITIHTTLNGEDREMTYPLQDGVTVDWVENKVRTTWLVSGGCLSSRQDRIEGVVTLRADGVYYFLGFQVAQPLVALTEEALKALAAEIVGVFNRSRSGSANRSERSRSTDTTGSADSKDIDARITVSDPTGIDSLEDFNALQHHLGDSK